MNADTNDIIRAYLVDQATLTDIVSARIYSPRLIENADLPAMGFFTRGGTAHAYIPGLLMPSVQFDCWGDSPVSAREVYRALYDVLQGIHMQSVTLDSVGYTILSALEEVQGQDLQDVDILNYYRVLTFFSFIIRAE